MDYRTAADDPVIKLSADTGCKLLKAAYSRNFSRCHLCRNCREHSGSEVCVQYVRKRLSSDLFGSACNALAVILTRCPIEGISVAGIITAVSIGRRRKITGYFSGIVYGFTRVQCDISGIVDIVNDTVYLAEHTADIAVAVMLRGSCHIAENIVVHKKGLYADPCREAADCCSAGAGIGVDVNVRTAVSYGRTLICKCRESAYYRNFVCIFDDNAA